MAVLNAEQALELRVDGEKTIELPSGSGEVIVKSLTKGMMNRIRDAEGIMDGDTINLGKLEPAIFREGMVQPKLTEEQVTEVFEHWPAGDVDAVIQAVAEASGLGEDFQKSGQDRDGAG